MEVGPVVVSEGRDYAAAKDAVGHRAWRIALRAVGTESQRTDDRIRKLEFGSWNYVEIGSQNAEVGIIWKLHYEQKPLPSKTLIPVLK
jgi:hypothetical protein